MFSERYSEWGNMMIYVRKASRKQSPHAKVKSSEGEQPVHVLEKAITMCIQDREMICISVSFVQEIYARKSLNIGPVIFASYIIPDGSDVVDAIKEGDVDRLKELLVSGEVKLYSRDWDGRSLLNVMSLPDGRTDIMLIDQARDECLKARACDMQISCRVGSRSRFH